MPEFEKPRVKSIDDIRAEVEAITDGLGKGIDEGIKEAVISVRAQGIETSGSCEGHEDWGLPYPWIDIEAPEPKGWEDNDILKAQWTDRNLRNRAKIEGLLVEYYGDEEPKLMLRDRGIYGAARLQPKVEDEASELSKYRNEMDAFSTFMRSKSGLQ